MLALHKSPYAGPFHSRSVKMNEFKTTNTTYCNRFQVGTCTFGERCRFKHEINNEFKPRDSVMVEMKKKDFTKDKKKKLPNTNIKRIFNPNNYRNSIAGRPRGNYVAGQPQKYFNEQVKTFTIFSILTVTMRKEMILKIHRCIIIKCCILDTSDI